MNDDTLNELIRSGHVTQEIADQARIKVDKTLQACAFALHTLMCNKEHEQDPAARPTGWVKRCNWYVEDALELEWDAPDHNFWLTKTIEVMREQEIDGSEEMRVFVKRLSETVEEARGMLKWYPKSIRLLEEILKT